MGEVVLGDGPNVAAIRHIATIVPHTSPPLRDSDEGRRCRGPCEDY